MHSPAVVTWLLVVLAAASGGYCLTRLRDSAGGCASARMGRREAREADAAEAAMSFGMAGMAVAPGTAWGLLYAGLAVLGLLGGLGPGTSVLRGHRLHHVIGALAMTYMALAMPGGHALHAHHDSAGLPLLTGALLLYFGGYALWGGSRLVTVEAGLPQACRVAMGIGMFAMLLTL